MQQVLSRIVHTCIHITDKLLQKVKPVMQGFNCHIGRTLVQSRIKSRIDFGQIQAAKEVIFHSSKQSYCQKDKLGSYHVSFHLEPCFHKHKSMNAISKMSTFSTTTGVSDLPYLGNTYSKYHQRRTVCLPSRSKVISIEKLYL